MEKLIITGGQALQGRLKINGAKNAALPLMSAALLAKGTHQFRNVPNLVDVRTMQKLLTHLGVDSQLEEKNLTLSNAGLEAFDAPYDLVKTMRASVLVLGPLVARWGKARVSLPGGCAIGARPINLHLDALKKMGASITLEEGYVTATCKKLQGADITFEKVTVTGTENIMMAATLANGTTVLRNCAKEPEIANLAQYLNKMGAKINDAGTDTITIEGVSSLTPQSHEVIADRIEAGTYLMAAAITGGEIILEGCHCDLLGVPIDILCQTGCVIQCGEKTISLKAPKKLRAVDIDTEPFPGFATDLQAQFMALMTLAEGKSKITETIFENRFQHALELQRLGAKIEITGHTALITGVPILKGAPMMATDLRASAGLVLAGLAAEGETQIERAYHIDRGYEKIETSLGLLGANISRERY